MTNLEPMMRPTGGGGAPNENYFNSQQTDFNPDDIEKNFGPLWDNLMAGQQQPYRPSNFKKIDKSSIKADVEYKSLVFDEEKLFAQDYLNIR